MVDSFVLYSIIGVPRRILLVEIEITTKHHAKSMRAALACFFFVCVLRICASVINFFQ